MLSIFYQLNVSTLSEIILRLSSIKEHFYKQGPYVRTSQNMSCFLKYLHTSNFWASRSVTIQVDYTTSRLKRQGSYFAMDLI